MLKNAADYERAAFSLIRGEKIEPGDYSPEVRAALLKQSDIMHRAQNIASEPQCYIPGEAHAFIDPKYRGKTHIHPIPVNLLHQAERLRTEFIRNGKPVIPFKVYGLSASERKDPDFRISMDEAGLLLPGDFIAMGQAMREIAERSRQDKIHHMAPVIVHNEGHYWEPLLQKSWPATKDELAKLNVFVSSGTKDTIDLLTQLPFGRKIAPQDIVLDTGMSGRRVPKSIIYATSDLIKYGHAEYALKQTGVETMRTAFDIFGPFPAGMEEQYSLEGNAEDKLRSLHEYLEKMGADKVEALVRRHGYRIDDTDILVQDSGLGFCLEKEDGARRIDLFSAKLFPDAHHRLNPMQMSPGVELANIKRAGGLERMMLNLEQSVEEFYPFFSRPDLAAYNQCVYMTVPLTSILKSIREGREFDLNHLGVVSVFSGEKLAVSPEPQFPENEPHIELETENYLIPPGQTQTRAQIPDWFVGGVNVKGFHGLLRLMGAEPDTNRPAPVQTLGWKLLDVLGTVEALSGRRSSGPKRMKSILKEFNIATRLKPDYWDRYRENYNNAANGYHAGMRKMLRESSIFYFEPLHSGEAGDADKVRRYLPLLKAIVGRQVSAGTARIVADQAAAFEVVELASHKKRIGLVQQRIQDLMTLAKDEKDAARKIAQIVHGGLKPTTPVERRFYSDGQVENSDCMTVTTYFSAHSCNKTLVTQAHHLGYLMAVNGISLKVGGGNEGLMRAVSDGFQDGKRELAGKGYDFPNQLILIQGVDTEALERPYEGGGIYRCHKNFEERIRDLQKADIEIAGAGGTGTDEEIFSTFDSRLHGLIDPKRIPFIFFNQHVETAEGMVGVHDPYKTMFSDKFMKEMNADHWTQTPVETAKLCCEFRDRMMMDASLSGRMNGAAAGRTIRFMPPYAAYFGPPGQLPEAPDLHLAKLRAFE
jgi:predicted Rossmann-fold nucleotide-binding protein